MYYGKAISLNKISEQNEQYKKEDKLSKYNFGQKRNDYMTPPEYINDLLNKIGIDEFDLDVCCSTNNIPAAKHFIAGEKDGLKEPWRKRNWMNCPFDECPIWIKKAYGEQQNGNTTYALIPARTETGYWHDYILHNKHCEVQFLRKGLCFVDPETLKPVQQKVKQKDGSYKLKNGVFKNSLALVVFHGLENSSKQLTIAA